MPDTDARAIVITGASTGIGRTCALDLAARGLRVFAGVRKEADAEALRGAHAGITPVRIDVTDDARVRAAAEEVAEATGGRLAGLVNNAGIVAAGPLEFLPLEAFRRQLEVNVTGQLAVTQAFLPQLRQARGRVVMMSSISGVVAAPLLGPYAASKFALEALADSLRAELAPWGLEVALVEPGVIATPIWDKSEKSAQAMAEELPEEALALYRPLIDGMRRYVGNAVGSATPPEAVARAVRHALLARRPRTRYLVGRDARLNAWAARLAPDRVRDWAVMRALGTRRGR
jgi:NAD(P)-dependent dehydrogenase (short-subunit alcohol dehydrogenase family)